MVLRLAIRETPINKEEDKNEFLLHHLYSIVPL
jgi:hypothetical protein